MSHFYVMALLKEIRFTASSRHSRTSYSLLFSYAFGVLYHAVSSFDQVVARTPSKTKMPFLLVGLGFFVVVVLAFLYFYFFCEDQMT